MTTWDQFGADYDFPAFLGEPQSYLIATTPRCGSHLLGHLLCETGLLGSPLEYFSKGRLRDWEERLETTDRRELFHRLFRRRTSPNGWFGVKAHWPQFEQMLDDAQLFAIFNFRRSIHMVRRDRIAQAVSWVIAQQTSAWISFHEPRAEPTYDFDAIAGAIDVIDTHTAAWRSYFSKPGTEPLEVIYEQLVDAPEAMVDRVLAHCGLSRPDDGGRGTPLPTRQASPRNEQWAERFRCDLVSRGMPLPDGSSPA